MYDILELNDKLLTELRQIAKELNIKRIEAYKKQELIYKILDQQAIAAAEIRPAATESTAKQPEGAGKRGRKPRVRVVRSVEKVGDSKGGVPKFAKREDVKREEVRPEQPLAVAEETVQAERPQEHKEQKRPRYQERPVKEKNVHFSIGIS